MAFFRVREPIEARRVDSYDQVAATDVAIWCAGSLLGDGTLRVHNGYGDQIAHHGEWIVKYRGDHGYGVFDDADFHSKYVEAEQ